MATVTRAAIPADEFALRRTIADLPDVEFECERIVESGDEAVMPLVWARNVDSEELESALEADPDVEEYSLLADFGEEMLYRMVWVDHVRLVLEMVTTLNATVMNAYSNGTRWELRILYPDRNALSKTNEFCESHGLSFEVLHVREMNGEPSGRFGLTQEQYEALTNACEAGYFAVPRETDLDELADELGISHQALSERIRRGSEVLVQEALLVGPMSDR
ncbi:helix-turn-helix domain-containing protein [Halomarina oriensis]|uniref:DNA-binding protein n=1 Tax=Halomarina oriensis TaxID=671145 RepID=A0A6B0GQN5_9EURY|nr:helix-turn-helix domain-containing protein [Halomarina oriensis]MWG33978.1 DNA-binding protein [Halomarina oriensis]